MWSIAKAEGEEKEKLSQQALQILEKEIEPLLKDAGPFFGGNSELTMAEVGRCRRQPRDFCTD